MTRWGYIRAVVHRALHPSWELAHAVHFTIVLAAGACAMVGWHFKEHDLIFLPFVTLALVLISGIFFWHTYAVYLEEHEKLLALEVQLAALRSGETQEQARQEQQRQISELILAGHRVQQTLTGTMHDRHEEVDRWLQEIAVCIQTNHPLHYGQYLVATGNERGTMRDIIQTRMRWLADLQNGIVTTDRGATYFT